MKEIKKDVEYGNKTIRVILRFPDESVDAATIQESVKSILVTELEEQLKSVLPKERFSCKKNK